MKKMESSTRKQWPSRGRNLTSHFRVTQWARSCPLESPAMADVINDPCTFLTKLGWLQPTDQNQLEMKLVHQLHCMQNLGYSKVPWGGPPAPSPSVQSHRPPLTACLEDRSAPVLRDPPSRAFRDRWQGTGRGQGGGQVHAGPEASTFPGSYLPSPSSSRSSSRSCAAGAAPRAAAGSC